MLRAGWVLCVSAGPCHCTILRRLWFLCGWGDSCPCPGCGALVAFPSRGAPPFGLRAVALWARRAMPPTVLRSGPMLQQHCC